MMRVPGTKNIAIGYKKAGRFAGFEGAMGSGNTQHGSRLGGQRSQGRSGVEAGMDHMTQVVQDIGRVVQSFGGEGKLYPLSRQPKGVFRGRGTNVEALPDSHSAHLPGFRYRVLPAG